MMRATVVGAAVLALGMAACGDGAPSRADFAKEVQAICEQAGRQHAAASKGFDFESFDPDTSDLAPLVPIVEDNVAIGREAASKIEGLEGPDDDVDKAATWAKLAGRLHDLGDQQAAALRQGDRAEFKRLAEQEEALHAEPTDELFSACS